MTALARYDRPRPTRPTRWAQAYVPARHETRDALLMALALVAVGVVLAAQGILIFGGPAA